jgi:hypothetical protein
MIKKSSKEKSVAPDHRVGRFIFSVGLYVREEIYRRVDPTGRPYHLNHINTFSKAELKMSKSCFLNRTKWTSFTDLYSIKNLTAISILASAHLSTGNPPTPVPKAGKAIDVNFNSSALFKPFQVASLIYFSLVCKSRPITATWITYLAFNFPAEVTMASPI